MGPSRFFLLALGSLLIHASLFAPLPGSGRPAIAVALCAAMIVPPLAARLARRGLLRLSPMSVPSTRLLIAIQIPSLLTALVFTAFVFLANLPDLSEQLAPTSWTLQLAVLFAPLIAMETATRIVERRTVRRLEVLQLPGSGELGLRMLPMAGLVILSMFLFGAVTDLVALDRELEVFFAGTNVGGTVGLVLLGGLLCFVLPLVLRNLLPVTRRFPDAVAPLLSRTAAELRFPVSQLLQLHTGHRMVNAAMVGPLPWPRYLMLTDGLVSFLPEVALRGVIAHEVGHARRSHPALLLLLFGIVPFLLLQPIGMAEDAFQELPFELLAAIGLLVLVLFLFVVRKLAHRFEFEADLWSAGALGGAAPCIDALRRVGELSPGQKDRASFRHPSERARVAKLEQWDASPEFRRRFDARGRLLRAGIAAALVVALGISAWAHARIWTFERGNWSLWTGDFALAERLLESADTSRMTATERLQHRWSVEECRAAREIEPAGGPWHEIRERLATEGWYRGLQELGTTDDPAQARPWLVLALAARAPGPLVQSACRWALAASAGDAESARAEELRVHLLTFGDRLPAELAQALAASEPEGG